MKKQETGVTCSASADDFLSPDEVLDGKLEKQTSDRLRIRRRETACLPSDWQRVHQSSALGSRMRRRATPGDSITLLRRFLHASSMELGSKERERGRGTGNCSAESVRKVSEAGKHRR